MGDEDAGHALGRELADGDEHLLLGLRIERGGDFVEQHDLRVHGERAGDGDTLLLTARKLTRIAVRLLRQSDFGQQAASALLHLSPILLQNMDRRHHHVLQSGLVRKQVVLLEHDPDLAAQRQLVELGIVDLLPLNRDRASSIGARPLMQRSSVDLPDPDGPMMQTVSPLRTVRLDGAEHGKGAERFLYAADDDSRLAQLMVTHRSTR